MSTRTIRSDEHGIYVRLDDSIFRPEVTLESRRFDPDAKDTVSKHKARDYVDARIDVDTPFAKVDDEIWHDHGKASWYDHEAGKTRQIKSEYCWNPMSRGPLTEVVLKDALRTAKGIAWDGCHKIYVLMDETEYQLTKSYGYDQGDSRLKRVTNTPAGIQTAYETVKSWFDDSCGLRFINAVKTVHGDPNKGFSNIVAQCEDWVDELY